MKGINPRTAFRNKKSFGGGMLRPVLRVILITGTAAAFLITYIGILDPQPASRKPMSDRDLRQIVAGMALTSPPRPRPGSVEAQRAHIGRRLFFDTRLSANQQVACSTCHQPDKSFTDGLPVAKGMGLTARNAPTIINTFKSPWFFWDGRADSLEAQAIGPLENAEEHGLDRASLAAILRQNYGTELLAYFPARPATARPETRQDLQTGNLDAYVLATTGPYRRLTEILKFAANVGIQPSQAIGQILAPQPAGGSRIDDDLTVARAALALAAWEKLQVANQSTFDRFVNGVINTQEKNLEQLSAETGFGPDALAGLRIFTGKGNCILCHRGPTLSDHEFHNIGLGDTPRQEQLEIKAWVADVAGRAKGLDEVLSSPWNCRSPAWRQLDNAREAQVRADMPACQEMIFLDPGNLENTGAFKTPTLRNVALTAPYFHDGRAATLDDVINHYDRLGEPAVVGHREESLRPLSLTDTEKKQLKAFLESLTSPVEDLSQTTH
jgi:cytochrome c peroxidase